MEGGGLLKQKKMLLQGRSVLLAIFLLIGNSHAECENENTMDNIWQEGATG